MSGVEKLTAEEIERKDAERLNQLGYKQELKRELSSLGNYGVALSVVCISSGLTSLFAYGLRTGGPVTMTWGWLVVSLFTLMVGLAMAEISSAYPTSGGIYWWAARLSTPKYAPLTSWMTGWFNLIGQFAITAGIDYGIALMLGSVVAIARQSDWTPTRGATVGMHFAICFSHGIANSLGPRVLRSVNAFSTWWQVVAPVVIIITIAAKAPKHQPASFVFGDFNNDTGWSNPAYVVLIGLLQAQFTLTGYDASAHMSEETKNAEVAGPVGMVMAILVSAVMGWVFIIGFLFCIQDLQRTTHTPTNFPVMQIMVDCVGSTGAVVLMVILMLACWFCGFASVTSNSRMIYAFARDGAIPGSRYWHTINHRLQTPLNAVWLSVFVAALLSLPSLGNATAFSAITSVATVGLYLSYSVPIFAKLINRRQFRRGPLHLGRFSELVGCIAVFWIAFITVLFLLPPENPVNDVNMNYACVAVGLVIIGAGGRFAIDGRKWFKGPQINLSDEERSHIELEQYHTPPPEMDDIEMIHRRPSINPFAYNENGSMKEEEVLAARNL